MGTLRVPYWERKTKINFETLQVSIWLTFQTEARLRRSRALIEGPEGSRWYLLTYSIYYIGWGTFGSPSFNWERFKTNNQTCLMFVSFPNSHPQCEDPKDPSQYNTYYSIVLYWDGNRRFPSHSLDARTEGPSILPKYLAYWPPQRVF